MLNAETGTKEIHPRAERAKFCDTIKPSIIQGFFRTSHPLTSLKFGWGESPKFQTPYKALIGMA